MLLRTSPGFSFRRVVFSHGWFDLPPFQWDPRRQELVRPLSIGRRRVVVRLREVGRTRLRLSSSAPGAGRSHALPLPRRDRPEIVRVVRHMLRCDEPFDQFHSLCRARPHFAWASAAGAGPLLRSPDPWEDLVKLICTTNCSWALTRVMVDALVRGLGAPAGQGLHDFPGPRAMAAAPASFYAREARCGYRGPYLQALAERVACGRLDPRSWLDPRRPTRDIRESIESIRGAGRYVSDNMLKLLGRYDGLGLDAWCRRKFSEIHHGGRRVSDRRIERFYAGFGAWRGLALWCDLTRDWLADDPPGPERLRGQKY